MYIPNYPTPQQTQTGWVSPGCSRCYSPTTPMCFTCGNKNTTTITSSSTTTPLPPSFTTMGGKVTGLNEQQQHFYTDVPNKV